MPAHFSYPYFMNHSLWDLFKISNHNFIFDNFSKLHDDDLHILLKEIVEAFYPVSYSSVLGFKRFSELAEDQTSSKIARSIYEVEMGKHPIIPGSRFKNVLHCDQLKIMISSLDNAQLNIPLPESFELIQKIDIRSRDLTYAMAICDVIENTAPYVIYFYQDFVAQYQYIKKVPSERIIRTYLDEHNLTEGSECEDQHIEMLDRMKQPYKQIEGSEAYKHCISTFTSLCEEHFTTSEERIRSLLNNTLTKAASQNLFA